MQPVEERPGRQPAVGELAPAQVPGIAGTAAAGLVPAQAAEPGILEAGRTRPRVRARTETAAAVAVRPAAAGAAVVAA